MVRPALSEHPIIAGVGMERDKAVDPLLGMGRTMHLDYWGYISAGTGHLELVRGQGQAVQAGAFMTLPAQRWHAFNPVPGTRWMESWLLLHPGSLPAPLSALVPAQPLMHGVRDPDVTLAWEALYDAWFFRPIGWQELAIFQLHRLLIAVHCAGLARPAALAGGRLRRLHQLLYASISQPDLDLHALARKEKMGYDSFRRHFRQLVGQAPKHYFLELKIAYAKEQLLQIGVPIAEVGRRVGIADQYYFSRLFRRKTGLSPREFRRRTLGLDEASRLDK